MHHNPSTKLSGAAGFFSRLHLSQELSIGSSGAAPAPKPWQGELQVMGGRPRPSDGKKDHQLLPSSLL